MKQFSLASALIAAYTMASDLPDGLGHHDEETGKTCITLAYDSDAMFLGLLPDVPVTLKLDAGSGEETHRDRRGRGLRHGPGHRSRSPQHHRSRSPKHHHDHHHGPPPHNPEQCHWVHVAPEEPYRGFTVHQEACDHESSEWVVLADANAVDSGEQIMNFFKSCTEYDGGDYEDEEDEEYDWDDWFDDWEDWEWEEDENKEEDGEGENNEGEGEEGEGEEGEGEEGEGEDEDEVGPETLQIKVRIFASNNDDNNDNNDNDENNENDENEEDEDDDDNEPTPPEPEPKRRP